MTIKELRESKGLTQGAFAETIGIGRTAIVGYEKGKFKPSEAVLARIKEVYGVDIAAPATEPVAPAEPAVPIEPAAPTEESKPVKRGKKTAPVPVEEQAPAAEAKGEVGIGAAIKALRTAKSLSQKAFGETIGVKLPTVGAYEQGRVKPSEAVMAKIKEVYGEDALEAAAPADEEQPVVEAPVAAPKKRGGRKKAAPAVEQPAAVEAPVVEAPVAAPKKRGGRKKAAPAVEEKKRTRKKAEAPSIIIQSPLGGSITPEEIIAKTGSVDALYIRVDENKAYWVKGEETGSVDLW